MTELRKKCHNDELDQNEATLSFAETERNWPYFLHELQGGLPGTTVEFSWKRGENEMTTKAAPAAAKNWFDSQRGWNLESMMFVQRAGSFSEAWRLGTRETVNATLLVYRTLHSVGTNQISIRNFGGPWTIIRVALMQARMGLGNLLIFLTLLSANLAVINFLPIPVLDGGHMVLLIYEGIRGKPADERVQEILTWIGLLFILSVDDLRFRARFRLDPPAGSRIELAGGRIGVRRQAAALQRADLLPPPPSAAQQADGCDLTTQSSLHRGEPGGGVFGLSW